MTTGPSDGEFALVFGLDTFGDVTHDDRDRPLSHAQTIRNLVDQGVLADEVGVDFFGVGEHHTDDFPLSAADVVLAAVAARMTDSGLPPTPIQAGKGPCSRCGTTS